MRGVVIDAVHHRAARTDVIGNVFDVSSAENAGREIEIGDLDANAVALAKQIGHREDFNRVFLDLPRRHFLPRLPRKPMPGLPWLRALWIKRPVRGLQPTTR